MNRNLAQSAMPTPISAWLAPPSPSAWSLSGTVVGALLNHEGDWAALGAAADAPPYKGRARAPVLQVKPRNTLVGDGARVGVPPGEALLEIGATLAVVIGRTAARVTAAQAMQHVAGYTLAADLRVPVDGPQAHYRPAVRQRARDGFCPIGPRIVAASAIATPDALGIEVRVAGRPVQHAPTHGRVRPVAQLIADISQFMTLRAGDIVLLGTAPGAPRAAAGSDVSLVCAGIGSLRFALVAAEGAGA